MRVVQILPELNEGGVERGVVELNREYVKKGLESIIISNGGKLVSQIELDGGLHIKFDVCSKNILSIYKRVSALKKILKEVKPDIIHVRSRVPAWLVYLANKKLNIKVISTVHGFNSVNKYSEIMTKSSKIICVSSSIKDYIKSNYKVPENITTIIPRGVDLKLFNPDNVDINFINNFKKQFNLENKFIVTSIGRITQLKDYETFIRSIAILKKEKKNIKALIVGGTRSDKKEYLNTLTGLIEDLDLKDNVIFTGSQEKVAEIYFLSDVVVSSSKKPESFGRAVAEAIAMNTPVVASNHGGVKDIILENENGLFFKVGDEKDLSEKITLLDKSSFNGYSYISNTFSLDKMVNKNLELYKGL